MTDDEVVARYVGLVKWLAHRTVHVNEYDDAVQDGLWAAVLANRHYQDGWSVSRDLWIRLTIHRRMIDGVRHRNGRRRRDVVSLETLVSDNVRVIDVLESPGLSPDAAVLAADLERFLRQLPTDEGDARVLNGLLDGRTQTDIAAEEGVTLARVSQRVARIRRRVRRKVNL